MEIKRYDIVILFAKNFQTLFIKKDVFGNTRNNIPALKICVKNSVL
jgi:hypothetical protein